MMSNKERKESRVFTVGVIVVSLLGIVYFGFQAMRETNEKNQENRFAYQLDSFKKTDAKPLAYRELEPIAIDGKDMYGIGIDEKDRLYVSVDQTIRVYDSKHQLLSSFATEKPAYCLKSDGNGSLFLGMADHIEIFDDAGTRLAVWPSLGDKAILTSLAISDQFVFAADAGNFVVWKYNKEGKVLSEIGRKDETKDVPGFIIPSAYFDVDLDPDGFLWVANTGRHSLENFTHNGSIRTSWGFAGMSLEGFAGCCNPSHFVIQRDGSFVTAEKGLARIKIYSQHGKLKSVVARPEDFIEGTRDLDLALDSQERIFVMDQLKKSIRIFVAKEEAK